MQKVNSQDVGTSLRRECPRAVGFTLIEVLVVVAIITILATIAVFVGVQVRRSAQDRNTKATLTALVGAMSTFIKDAREPDDAHWVAALMSTTTTSSILSHQKISTVPDLAAAAKSGFPVGSQVVLDGYGNPIHYIPRSVPPATGLQTGHFQSYGPDGIGGNADDVDSEGAAP